MNCKDNRIASSAAVMVAMVGLALLPMASARAVQGEGAVASPHAAAGKPKASDEKKDGVVVLVRVDEEMAGYIDRASEMVAQKDYAGAIEILQALLDRPKQCFVPTDDAHRFVPLSVKANEAIGRLPPEGVELYRRLYDARAERLFRTAAERLDESALRDIIRRYLHTSYGDDALNLLGAIQFDRGEFSHAAYYWGRIVSTFDIKDEAVLLAKIAVAHHFVGESACEAEAMKMLTQRHPKARAVLGGREENVAVFTKRVLASAPPLLVGPRRLKGWPSLAGAPNSVAVMSLCRPALSLRWTVPGGKLADNPNIEAMLALIPFAHGRRPVELATVLLNKGRVVYTPERKAPLRGVKRIQTVMPSHIHPIVVGSTVLYRCAEGVVARDLLTGEKLWESLAFSLYRTRRRRRHLGGSFPLAMIVEDHGHWTLTAGDGKVFAVGGFLLLDPPDIVKSTRRGPIVRRAETSALAAFSLADQGRLLWQVGKGEGQTDLLRGGKFLSAPTYAAGRVYVVVDFMEAHYIVCLNAENGRLVWEARIGQMPALSLLGNNYQGYQYSRGSPPAVAEGRVFVTTNAGMAAAFQAGTGRVLWAYQYESNVNRQWSRNLRRSARPPSYPPNPIVVTKGRAIFLPADGKQLLALRADTGQLDWSADRRGQRDLAAVDDSRLLLSGGGIRIIDATTGRDVWTAQKVNGVHGRPAVTPDAILAAGRGQIIRVSLRDFTVTRLPVTQPDAILGNLICVDGKLLAANAAGLSAYFSSRMPARN